MELEKLIELLRSRAQDPIPGSLRISVTGGQPRFYHMLPGENGKIVSHYLSRDQIDLVRRLAQQDYEKKLLSEAERLLWHVKEKEAAFDDHSLQSIYQKLHPIRRDLISPLVPSDEDYIEQWLKTPYQPGWFSEDAASFITDKEERVRSKSEKIIADNYYRQTIPYVYERPLNLKNSKGVITIRPDFTVLNIRTRQQFYHEHFGMIDHPEYADNMIKKLELYASNGIFPGEQLLVTMESSRHPISMTYLNQLIKKYLV